MGHGRAGKRNASSKSPPPPPTPESLFDLRATNLLRLFSPSTCAMPPVRISAYFPLCSNGFLTAPRLQLAIQISPARTRLREIYLRRRDCGTKAYVKMLLIAEPERSAHRVKHERMAELVAHDFMLRKQSQANLPTTTSLTFDLTILHFYVCLLSQLYSEFREYGSKVFCLCRLCLEIKKNSSFIYRLIISFPMHNINLNSTNIVNER
jgi:hypothetical protein